MRPHTHKRSRLHHFAADFLKCACAQMCHADGFSQHHLLPQLFKAGQEHPCVLGDHCLIAILFCHTGAHFNKNGKQIALAVGIILLHILRQLCAHAGTAHIGRIGDDHIVFLRQGLCHPHQWE